MEFIAENWNYILLGVFVADNIVKVTPWKWDDLVVTTIKKCLGFFKKPM